MIVAIDGYSGTGKSAIASKIAKKYGLTYFNTGNIYRAYTYVMLENNLNVADVDKVIELMKKKDLVIQGDDIILDGEVITSKLRNDLINKHISELSPIPIMRACVHEIQFNYINNGNIIMEGRDITSNIMKDTADLKLFFSASEEVRVRRNARFNALGPMPLKDYTITEKRDGDDVNRKDGKLTKTDDSIEIDTSFIGIDEVFNLVCSLINNIDKPKVMVKK